MKYNLKEANWLTPEFSSEEKYKIEILLSFANFKTFMDHPHCMRLYSPANSEDAIDWEGEASFPEKWTLISFIDLQKDLIEMIENRKI